MKFLLINKILLQLFMFITIGAALHQVNEYLCLAYILFIICSWGTAFFDSQIRALQAQEIVDKLQSLKKEVSDNEEK